MSSTWFRDRRTALALRFAAVTSLLFAGTASAQFVQKPLAESDADLKVTVAGQIVSVDPKTGRLRTPTPQQAQTLIETLRRIPDEPQAPITVITHMNGMLSVELPESFVEVAMARLNPDGSLAIECVEPEGVDRALAEAAAKSAVKAAAPVAVAKTAAKKPAATTTLAKRRAATTTRATAAKKPSTFAR